MNVAEAESNLATLVDQVYAEGISIDLERDGKVIARLTPAEPWSSLTVGRLNAFLRNLPSLGDDTADFASDVYSVHNEFPTDAEPNSMARIPDIVTRAAYDRILEILQSTRSRKEMYFLPVSPVAAIHCIHGLQTGFSFAGLEWSPDHRRAAIQQRGLVFRVAATELDELRKRGLTDEAIVDELLAIEIDMWQSQRDANACD